MNLESWQLQAQQKLGEIEDWLTVGQKMDVPYGVYGTLAGLTVWPLVVTASTTPHITPIILILAKITANVGTNHVANQIEAWKNSDKIVTEMAVINWLRTEVAQNNALRQELDAIIEKLDVIAYVKSRLSQADQAWFMAQFQKATGPQARFEGCQYNVS